jgi:rhodanese-related sulfurtransferase
MADAAVVPDIDVDTAASRTEAVLLDVRGLDEWRAGHAPTAINIPMDEVPARIGDLHSARPIVCVCRSGNRSGRVTAWLRSQGVDAVNMTGGMQAWSSAGLPVVDEAGNPGVVI